MLKADSLRDTLTHSIPWCRANPEAFTVFVEAGHIETTGEAPSFMYSYTLVLFVMNFAGDIDDFTLPLLAWLWHNQPALLLNPEKNRQIAFTTLINNDDTADILFEMPISERVKVTLDAHGIPRAEHLPEPRPRLHVRQGGWGDLFEGASPEAAA